MTRGPFHFPRDGVSPLSGSGCRSSDPRTGGTVCSLRRPGWNCTCSIATAGRSPLWPASSGCRGARPAAIPRRPHHRTIRPAPSRWSSRQRSWPTSSAASRPVPTCAQRCSFGSSATTTRIPAATPACAGGWWSCARSTRPSPSCASRPDPASRPRATGPTAGPGHSVTAAPSCMPGWRSWASAACWPSASPPTRRGAPPCAPSCAASTTWAAPRPSTSPTGTRH